jgi:hypothetical protein
MRRVGDESDTFFRANPWVDGIPLCERFVRLFDLAETNGVRWSRCHLCEWFGRLFDLLIS